MVPWKLYGRKLRIRVIHFDVYHRSYISGKVFGCVTMDSKLQLWDLSVSAIDPIISIDTTIETEVYITPALNCMVISDRRDCSQVGDAAVAGEDGKDKNLESPPTTAPAANGNYVPITLQSIHMA